MKITDQQLLDYIWDETLSAIVRNTFVRYMGNELGTYSLDVATSEPSGFAVLHRINLYAGAPLSQSRFRTRIKKLISQGNLLPRLGYDGRSFVINSIHLAPAVLKTVKLWQEAGLPFGYEGEGYIKSCKTIPAEGLDLFALSQGFYQILRKEYPSYM
ncbi:hypothetical protein BKG95_10305 [Rodentibacter pneumotropicus]|uniref:Uncharacterized protein n=1 Tax=Rodentibacter pneumotropicus TaxID=758 RepID=A0AAW5LCV6_9PAST|nr:hypothetical protein [Rodentibacter pneumotropicus]MCQ9121280.1 hypothetical protein [Rodentibacter pneumotropicus]OOF66591.1 hypothetical protein BKG95_10305 [Rodentibacter pneumotropicus]